MNSRQRRQDRREWRYKIDLGSRPYDDYAAMFAWLGERHGRKIAKCGWRSNIEPNNNTDDEYFLVWQFLREQDAAEFALRWA